MNAPWHQTYEKPNIPAQVLITICILNWHLSISLRLQQQQQQNHHDDATQIACCSRAIIYKMRGMNIIAFYSYTLTSIQPQYDECVSMGSHVTRAKVYASHQRTAYAFGSSTSTLWHGVSLSAASCLQGMQRARHGRMYKHLCMA